MERLILSRHAESGANTVRRVNGSLGETVRLTATGREQARALGVALADEPIGVCATSEFPRTIETADLALAGRDVPRLVLPDLNEIGFGVFEGLSLAEYREWANAHGSAEVGPGGAEPRAAAARRFARVFRELLAREEATVLVVTHALAIRYLLSGPSPYVEPVPLAEPHVYARAEAALLLEQLEAWLRSPTW